MNDKELEQKRKLFIDRAMNDDNAHKCINYLKKNKNVELTLFSYNDALVLKILDLKDKTDEQSVKELDELVKLIKESNRKEIDITELMKVKVDNIKGQTEIDMFFESFENTNTKERLFIIMGETGVGKSYMVEQRYPDIPQYACNSSLDPYTLCYYLSDKEGTGLKPYETPFLKAIKMGGKVYLDEMNELPHETLMFLQGITDEKKSVVIGDENIEIDKDFRIIATLNPPSETDERRPLGDALLSRSVGIVLELTNNIISERLGVTLKWIQLTQKLYNNFRQSGLYDLRELNFRDYQRLSKYDFEMQLKYKICMGDVKNIAEFNKISGTQEYMNLIKEIKQERK